MHSTTVDDLKALDAHLRTRCDGARARLRDLLAGRRLTLAAAETHRVLIPMEGLYTPGFQALPAWCWELVELRSEEGPCGVGEWSVRLDEPARAAIARLEPGADLLDLALEPALGMAWWDLVGRLLERPLHRLWAELFELAHEPPDRVPLAAYSWQRMPAADGSGAIGLDTWPAFARDQVDAGFPSLKLSMTTYDPDVYVEVVERVRALAGWDVDIRVDTHGSWNYREAKAVLPRLEPYRLAYVEQPFNSLLPPADLPGRERWLRRGYQAEHYLRRLGELRGHVRTPFSDHWWPPLVLDPARHIRENSWSFDWELIERYDPIDIAVPDIGLGVFGLWRMLSMARAMGLGITLHSNSELAVQTSYRAAMQSALGSYPDTAGLYMGVSPRLCLDMDTEYNQVSDDVVAGGKVPFDAGHWRLSPEPGHGRALDPERLRRFAWTPERAATYRAHRDRTLGRYVMDRPRRRSASGWTKAGPAERFHHLIYPYDVDTMLDDERGQRIDVALWM